MTLPEQVLFIREVGDDRLPYWTAASEDGVHLVLEQGETHLGSGKCKVASLGPDQWTLPDDTLLVATDRRIAFLTAAFDKGGGWVGLGPAGLAVALTANAISHRKAANRSAGKVAVGHLRYEWIESVELCRRKALIGVVDSYLDITVSTTAGSAVIELWGRGVANDQFAYWLVAMVARQRLELHVQVESADRATLERLSSSGGPEEAARLSGVAKWIFPGKVEDLISAASAARSPQLTAIIEPPQPRRPPMNGNESVRENRTNTFTGPQGRTNTLAIVSFVSSFLVAIVGVVTGHMALRQIRRTGEGGRGLAIAGLAISYVFVGLIVLLVGYFAVAAPLSGVASRSASASQMPVPSAASADPPGPAQEGPTPANSNIHGGVTLLANSEVARSDPATVNMAELPSVPASVPAAPTPPGAEAEPGKPVKVVVYVDFICPVCKIFETEYSATLAQLRNDGKITVEYRALGMLDARSTTNYSSRAANAAACVANESPEKYSDFFNALYNKQPAEGSAGLSDSELKSIATHVGSKNIDKCVDNKTYRLYVKHTTQEAQVSGVTGTPTVFVEGKQWGAGDSAQTPFDEFLRSAIEAKK